MKTLQESIIGRKGVPARFTKDMLKPGYIVQYRDGELGMYLDYEDAVRISRTRSLGPRMNGEGGFFSMKHVDLSWMPVGAYNDDLKHTRGNKNLDIITVWPVKTQPQLLDQEYLKHLTKGVAPIKINQ